MPRRPSPGGQYHPGAGSPLYHRRASPTQTAEDARTIERTGELWGRPRRGSEIPQVQAFRGPLPAGVAGIEFTTPVSPDVNAHPQEVRWSAFNPDPRVRVEDGWAKIPVTVTRNTQVVR